MPQQHTPAAGSGQTSEQQIREFWEHEFNQAINGTEMDGTLSESEAIALNNAYLRSQISAFDQPRKVFGFSLFGWRFEAYREPTDYVRKSGGAA